MSHQVPEYFRYVSSITINNPGTGYTSIPTITISGGGGTGATATATIFNGQIQAVNITNVGQDYTTAPTVTVTGGGGENADLTAVLAFAAGTPTDYEEKSALGIKYTLPEFIRNDYNQFVTFIEKYYEYMDSDGNPSNLLLNTHYNDIDDLNDAELNKRALELAENFPQILQTDRKSLLKNIKNIYESKGSDRSIKAYFKLLYNEDVEVYYPSKNILRASDGIWIEETSVRATSGFNNYEVLNLNGRVADIKYYETTGSVTLLKTIPITIPRVEKIAYTSPQAYEVVIKLPAGVTDVPGPGSQATATATVTSTETEYNNGAIINVTGDGSDFFKREVTVNGVRIMGAGTVGGQQAVPDAWLEKVARMVELFLDPNGAGINETTQRNLIKTLSGDTGTYHAGFPTIQRVARGSGSEYTPNFLTDAGIISWNLTNLYNTTVKNDMVWYLNSSGVGYGDGDIDAQEVIEHVFHTLHMHGLTDDIKLYSHISADWATGPLYAAMEEAFDAGKWDPSGYQINPDDWKTDSEAFEVAAKEYLYLLNFCMFEYTSLWDGGSLAPEWTDDMRTQAGIQANNPLGYAFHNTYIAPVISKPSLATIRSIFQDGNTPAQDDPSLAGASGYVVDTVAAGEITEINVTFGGYGYTAAPIVEIYDTNGGIGATARAVVKNGAVTSIIVNDGGSGYDPLTTSVTFNTDSIRSFIVERGANSSTENIRAYLNRSLSSVTSGTYVGLNAGFSVGDVFAVNESGDDGTGYALPGYFAGDYTFTGGSNNAVIRVAAVDTSGVPTSWSIINPGEGFRNAQTVITITSKTGEGLDVTLFTKYLYSYDGKYKDDRGKLSDVNRLQDNYKYQSYSYIIKSTISQNQWVKRFRDLMHPAGMEVFGDLIITNNINFAPFIEITTDGLNLHEFKTEDIAISNDDVITIVVQWVRAFTDTSSANEISSFGVQKPIADFAGASSEFDEDVYVEPDYLPEYYVGPGLSKHVDKNLTEATTSLDILSPVVNFVRAFADEVANSTDSIVLALAISTSLSDATNAATDTLIISTGPSKSDTVSASDDYYQEYVEDDYLPLNYTGFGVSKYIEKVLTDISIPSELLERVVDYNRVFTDSGSAAEALSFNMSADLGNQIVVTDDFTYDIFIAHILSDSVHVDDAELFSLSLDREFIDDDVTHSEFVSINTEKGLVEAQTASESNVITLQKPFTETGNIADSGVITIQDYSDPTYFSEDYVGAGYNF